MNQHLNGHSDIAVGNVIGSCICNLLLVLGCSSIVRPLIIKKESKIVDIQLNLIAIVLILIFGNQNFLITKKEGIILLAIFAVFILYTVISGSIISEQSDDDEQNKQRMSLIKSIIVIIKYYLILIPKYVIFIIKCYLIFNPKAYFDGLTLPTQSLGPF